LHDAGLPLHRVSAKAASDYSEVFDNVPSQHDGKDAAVIAELAAWKKSTLWPFDPPSAWEGELADQVQWMDSQQQIEQLWVGRLEGQLARHWRRCVRCSRRRPLCGSWWSGASPCSEWRPLSARRRPACCI